MIVKGFKVNPPLTCRFEWDFVKSSDVGDFNASVTGAGSTFAQVAAAGGAVRLTTDAADNDRVEVQLDAAPMVLPTGRTIVESLFQCPSDVDNLDLGLPGWITTDTDWLGDAATATELLYVGFNDQGSSDGTTPLTLFYKNANGSGSVSTGLNMKEGKYYYFQLIVDKTSSTQCMVTVVLVEVTAFGTGVTSVEPSNVFQKEIANLCPTGATNLTFGIQNGEAVAKTFEIDLIGLEFNRYSG